VQNEIYNCYGWYNVKISELFNCETDDAKRVVYLESLISKNSGNNPHIGNGLYDDGESYIEKFTDFFKDYRENGYFELLDTEIYTYNDEIQDKYESIKDGSFGFKYDENGGEIIDNKKCAYFHDYIINNKPWTGDTESNDGSSYSWNSEPYKGIEFPDTPVSDIDDIADESQANAIINLKKLVITFGTQNNKYLKDYILNVVLTYLEEMIPATTILEYRFDSDNVNNAVKTNFYPEGSYIVLEAAHAMVKNNENVINWREYPNEIIPN
jgi:hypothetical protein